MQPAPNGIIIQIEPFVPHAYESLEAADQATFSSESYAECINWYNNVNDVQFLKINYMSDGLKVIGLIARPIIQANKKYPVIVYNRGGTGNSGKNTIANLKEVFYPLTQAGYVVLASQYRGNDGGQGKDELGGSDVNDVAALFDIIHTIDYLDKENIFMFSYSRGGLMTYQILRRKFPVKAAAVTCGITDLIEFEKAFPYAKRIFESMIPNLPEHRDSEYQKRSVMYWPEAINVPLLLLHASDDSVVNVKQAQTLAAKLTELGKPHELVIYPHGDHALTEYRPAINQRVIAWFARYKE